VERKRSAGWPVVRLLSFTSSMFAKLTCSTTFNRSPGWRTGVKKPSVRWAISTVATGPSRASGPMAKEWIRMLARFARPAARSTARTLSASKPGP
jgi:hypothetical protein